MDCVQCGKTMKITTLLRMSETDGEVPGVPDNNAVYECPGCGLSAMTAEPEGLPHEERVFCRLAGEDGNAFAIMGRVDGALRKAGLKEEAEEFAQLAVLGDYDHLLQTAMRYVRDDDEDDRDEDEEHQAPSDVF